MNVPERPCHMDRRLCSNKPEEGDQVLCRYWWNHQVTGKCLELLEKAGQQKEHA